MSIYTRAYIAACGPRAGLTADGLTASKGSPDIWDDSLVGIIGHRSSGKYAFAVNILQSTGNDIVVGVARALYYNSFVGNNSIGWGFHNGDAVYHNGINTGAWAGTAGTGDVVIIAVEFDGVGNFKAWGGIQTGGTGAVTWAGDPAAGTGESVSAAVPNSYGLRPTLNMLRTTNSASLMLTHDSISDILPAGFSAWEGVYATITFAANAIVDAADSPVTATGVKYDVISGAGVWLATGTANISGGAATINFAGDVTNGEVVRVTWHDWDGATAGQKFQYSNESVVVSV